MARKPHQRRRRKKLFVPTINATLALGALADQDLISATLGQNPGIETFLMSMKATWNLDNATPGEGPILVGVAHEDYTDAEIEEYLENTQSWSPQDLVGQEIANRKIRIVGSFGNTARGGTATTSTERLQDGKPIKTICRWVNSDSQSLKIWAFNKAGGPLTTGGRVVVVGNAFMNRL